MSLLFNLIRKRSAGISVSITSDICCKNTIPILTQRFLASDNRKNHFMELLDHTRNKRNEDDSNIRVAKGQINKIGKGLNDKKKEKPVLDNQTRGYLESLAGDIQDILNDSLATDSFMHIFGRKARNAATLVEIINTTINQDSSHVIAYWECTVLQEFVRKVKISHHITR